jgi:ribosome-binding protein aMBF1 (putative translation factor)|uniref:HTH cro/C1-type domain-containing protein n=1 Tax=viral metagenome TaxID=1070528 RepID=A0A6C0DJR5_9ZZZZ
MDYQDWNPITIRSSTAVATVAKKQAGPKVSDAVHSARKIDAVEVGRLKTLTSKSRSEMAQARVAKGLTQKQLDQRGQFPANTCNLWESGKMCPSGPQINILHRILGIKLERE